MGVIPEKKDYKNVSSNFADSLAKQLSGAGYELVSRVRPTERSHFDRFGFVKDQKRVVVVYDVKAKILSVTAFDKHFNEICAMCDKLFGIKPERDNNANKLQKVDNNANKSLKADNSSKKNKSDDAKQLGLTKKRPAVPEKSNLANKPQNSGLAKNNSDKRNSDGAKNSDKSQNGNKQAKTSKIAAKNIDENRSHNQSDKKSASDMSINSGKNSGRKIDKDEPTQKLPVSNNDSVAKDDTKNDFTLKKYTTDRFDATIDNLKRSKIKIKLKETQGSANETVNIYELSGDGNKITVRFMPHKRILQIQGKSTDFLRKIQTVFSEGGDFKSALDAHIEQKQTDTRAADIERQLKKYLPTGILYLSSQAKIDFSIGIVDLLPGEIVLSDYSSLLIPPYRGLEMLIFDLQRAQGIKVKMIGQAFEKDDDGNYVLKTSFRRKIGSVIFAEVMASLYTEYNSTRNFYVHSAYGQQTKVIADKNQAIAIYERMLKVVEYNSKKLKEIGFSL